MSKFVVEIFSGENEAAVAAGVEKYINGLSDRVSGDAAANIQWKTCAVSDTSPEHLGCYITAIVSYWER